jgi:hypothetical protein
MSFRYDEIQYQGGISPCRDMKCGGAKQIPEIFTLGHPQVVQDDFSIPASSHGLQRGEAVGLDLGRGSGDAKVAVPFITVSAIVSLLL